MTHMAKGVLIIALALDMFVLGGCAFNSVESTPSSGPPPPTLAPVPAQHVKVSSACSLPPAAPSPDSNPQVGDIPDTQVFVTYQSSSAGYRLQVPEGWARATNGTDVSFVNKLDGVQISLMHASIAPTARSV